MSTDSRQNTSATSFYKEEATSLNKKNVSQDLNEKEIMCFHKGPLVFRNALVI